MANGRCSAVCFTDLVDRVGFPILFLQLIDLGQMVMGVLDDAPAIAVVVAVFGVYKGLQQVVIGQGFDVFGQGFHPFKNRLHKRAPLRIVGHIGVIKTELVVRIHGLPLKNGNYGLNEILDVVSPFHNAVAIWILPERFVATNLREYLAHIDIGPIATVEDFAQMFGDAL